MRSLLKILAVGIVGYFALSLLPRTWAVVAWLLGALYVLVKLVDV